MAKTLTLEQAKAALAEAMAAFDEPSNAAKMDEAKAAAGGDLQKMMMTVMPLALQIQGPTFAKYGFDANQTGGMQFIMAVMAHQADPEVAQMTSALKSKYLPTPKA
jgi:hypothetical protein